MNYLKANKDTIYDGDKPVILRGFGLGGWFLPEGYMWKIDTQYDRPRRLEKMIEDLCGKEYAINFWQQYLDTYITKKDIEFIAKEGFNSVRLPLNARHLYQKQGQQFILNTSMFHRIDTLIDWCRLYGIYVIIDMHGAPGGQTGQNIDDCEVDQPYLFMQEQYAEELSFLWKEIAARYRKEPIVAGYDLLNEPVPEFFSQYNDKVLPLYRRLIRDIREIDPEHMIILEGVHWATDFSIFDSFTPEEAADNILLQFHKYWNNPDAESLAAPTRTAKRLNIPLFMGEGGENNCDWYTTAFPMYEQLGISWSFWSYKKMSCKNSPLTFDMPEGWDNLISWMKGDQLLGGERARSIFNDFLSCIKNARINPDVLKALKREVPVRIPCEAYNDFHIISERIEGAKLRKNDPVSIIFENGRIGEVDYKRYGGEEQPPEENLQVRLQTQDKVGYLFCCQKEEFYLVIHMEGEGELHVRTGLEEKNLNVSGKGEYAVTLKCNVLEKQHLWLCCERGEIKLDYLLLSEL